MLSVEVFLKTLEWLCCHIAVGFAGLGLRREAWPGAMSRRLQLLENCETRREAQGRGEAQGGAHE